MRLEARTERLRQSAAEARQAAESPFGDIWEYRMERADEKVRDGTLADREAALTRLRPGDVLTVKRGRYRGPAVMVASASRKSGMRLTVISEDAEAILVTSGDIPGPIAVIGHVKLPGAFLPKSHEYRRDVARRLSRASLKQRSGRERHRREGTTTDRRSLHPVEFDPDLRERMRAAGQVERFERELAQLTTRVDGHNRSLGREFDRVIDVLGRRGYVSRTQRGEGGDRWSLTRKGTMLASVFHESDLLIAECLSFGFFDDVDAPVLAGLLSTFVYEHRSPEPPAPPWFPNELAGKRWRSIAAASEDLAADEQSSELGVHRPPDPGFFAAAHGWTVGHALGTVVGDEELTGGDFVRTMKQLIDLARQVGDVAPSVATRDLAREVASVAYRGIVADGTLSGVDEGIADE